MRNINRLNEEIARWAFEIRIKENSDWFIAFTNPTAGPWKTIKAKSLSNKKIGEIYRFNLEEDRPDIIMYSDKLKIIIIIEAKDNLKKLADVNQAKKSVEVVQDLGKKLSKKGLSIFWNGRENYLVILGLLWGAENESSNSKEIDDLFDKYIKLVNGKSKICNKLIYGIETIFKNGELSCCSFLKSYSSDGEKIGHEIKKSINF